MTQTRILAGVTLVLAIAVLFFAGVQEAQTLKQAPSTVFVNVAVTGEKDAYVSALKPEHFQILEDNKPQKITYFSADNGPWNIGIILGVSTLLPGSADQVSQHIRGAVSAFQKTGNPDNKYFVDELRFGSDGIFDAMSRGLVRLSQGAGPRKALLVITDGFDTTDGDPGHALLEFAKKLSNIPLYLVYVRSGSAGTNLSLEEVGRGQQYHLSGGRVFEEIASATGGYMTSASAEYELDALCKRIATELKSQYVIGFNSTNDTKLGTWRKLSVKLTPPKEQAKAKARLKSRYFAPKPEAANTSGRN